MPSVWADRSLCLLLHLKAASPELCPPTCCLFFPTLLSPTAPSLSMSNPHLDWKLSPTRQGSALELRISLRGCQPGTQGTRCLGFNSRQHHREAERPSWELDVGLLRLRPPLVSWVRPEPVPSELRNTSRQARPALFLLVKQDCLPPKKRSYGRPAVCLRPHGRQAGTRMGESQVVRKASF